MYSMLCCVKHFFSCTCKGLLRTCLFMCIRMLSACKFDATKHITVLMCAPVCNKPMCVLMYDTEFYGPVYSTLTQKSVGTFYFSRPSILVVTPYFLHWLIALQFSALMCSLMCTVLRWRDNVLCLCLWRTSVQSVLAEGRLLCHWKKNHTVMGD